MYYFLNEHNIQQGPLSLEQLVTKITPATLVWREGLTNWVPASSVPEVLIAITNHTAQQLQKEQQQQLQEEQQQPLQEEPIHMPAGMYYYLDQQNNQQGPIAIGQLPALITPQTYVWRDDMPDWMPASNVPEVMQAVGNRLTVSTDNLQGNNLASAQEVTPAHQVPNTGTPIQQEKSSNNLIFIFVAIAVVLVGVIVFLLLRNSKDNNANDDNYTSSPVTEEVEEVEFDENNSEEDSSDNSTYGFTEVDFPTGYNMGEELADMAISGNFAGTHYGMTAGELSNSNVWSEGTVSGKQFKFERYPYLIQMFFDGSPYDDSSTITGVALSCDMDYEDISREEACSEFEGTLDSYGLSSNGRSYITESGAWISGGYKGSRFYIYYYYPNATSKDPAPRN